MNEFVSKPIETVVNITSQQIKCINFDANYVGGQTKGHLYRIIALEFC